MTNLDSKQGSCCRSIPNSLPQLLTYAAKKLLEGHYIFNTLPVKQANISHGPYKGTLPVTTHTMAQRLSQIQSLPHRSPLLLDLFLQ
jgi:hypothetical protein